MLRKKTGARRTLITVLTLTQALILGFIAGYIFLGDGSFRFTSTGSWPTVSPDGQDAILATINIKDSTSPAQHPLSDGFTPERLDQVVRSAITEAGATGLLIPPRNLQEGELPTGTDLPVYRLDVEMALAAPPPNGEQEKRTLRLASVMLLRRIPTRLDERPERYSNEVFGQGLIDADSVYQVEELILETIEKNLQDTFLGILIQYEANRKPEEQLLADLESPHPEIRLAAIRSLGKNGDPERVIPRLAPFLHKENEAVVMATIGALASTGSPDAISALADSTRNRSTEYLSRVLYVMGDIGGLEAEAFIDTVAVGHPDPVARLHATQALETMREGREGSVLDSFVID